jgi:tetratricopeptide (TPR) repeat protein
MSILEPNDYGPLNHLVSTAGWLLATAGALILGFKRRARWEPSEEDVSRGPQRVGSLLVVVAIAMLWTQARTLDYLPQLNRLTLALLGITILSLLIYGILIGTLTYEKVDSPGGTLRKQKIIGGFWLTKGAKLQLRKKASARSPVFLTKQQLLKGAAYDPDLVWSPFSRSLAKAVFVIFYLGLTAFGTITLLCASIILDLGQTSAYYESVYTEATKCQHQDDRKSLDCELNAYKILLAGKYKIVSVNHNLGWAYERLARFENCKDNTTNALNSYSEAISYLERGIKPETDLSTASSLDDLYLARAYANERAGHLDKAAEDFAEVCNKVITANNCEEATRELGRIRQRIQEAGRSEIEPQCQEL